MEKNETMKTIDRQKAILGTLLISPAAFYDVSQGLRHFMFEAGALQSMAEIIWQKNRQGLKYDIASFEGIMSAAEVQGLIDCATSRDVLPDHIEQVRKGYFTLKDLEYQSEMRTALLNGEDYSSARGSYQMKVQRMLNDIQSEKSISSKLMSAIDRVNKAMSNPNSISGIPTPYNHINAFTAGHQYCELDIVGARPGMGKTTYLAENAITAASMQYPTAVFSMGDLTAEDFYNKIACLMAGLKLKDLRRGMISKGQFTVYLEKMDLISNWPIYVYDVRDVSNRSGDIIDKMRWGAEKHGWKMVMIDYIQQIKPDQRYKDVNAEMEAIVPALRQAAVQTEMNLKFASQLSRAVETRGGTKRPLVSDLRGSGALEQDADSISFLYRPGYYGITEDEEGFDISKRTEVIYLKHRIAGDEVPATFNLRWNNERLEEEEGEAEQGLSDIQDEANFAPESLPHAMKMPRANTDEELPF